MEEYLFVHFLQEERGKKNTYIALLVLQRMQKRTTFLFRVLQPLLLLLSNGFSFLSLSLSLSLSVYVLRSYNSATTLFSLSDSALEMVLHNFCFSLSLSLSIFLSLNMFILFSLSRTRTKVVLFCVVLSLFLSLSLSV